MKIPTSAELHALINSLPASVPLSSPSVQTLLQWADENSVEMQPIHYTLDFTIGVAAAAAAQQVNIDSAAPFMLVSQQYWAAANPVLILSEANRVIPAVNVLITDLQSGRNWQNTSGSGTPVWSIFGSAGFPYYYPQPRLMAANSALNVVPTNLDTVDDLRLLLVFTGYRFYQG